MGVFEIAEFECVVKTSVHHFLVALGPIFAQNLEW